MKFLAVKLIKGLVASGQCFAIQSPLLFAFGQIKNRTSAKSNREIRLELLPNFGMGGVSVGFGGFVLARSWFGCGILLVFKPLRRSNRRTLPATL